MRQFSAKFYYSQKHKDRIYADVLIDGNIWLKHLPKGQVMKHLAEIMDDHDVLIKEWVDSKRTVISGQAFKANMNSYHRKVRIGLTSSIHH
jgi:hypothetical protein